jgi:hypothetical protein
LIRGVIEDDSEVGRIFEGFLGFRGVPFQVPKKIGSMLTGVRFGFFFVAHSLSFLVRISASEGDHGANLVQTTW